MDARTGPADRRKSTKIVGNMISQAESRRHPNPRSGKTSTCAPRRTDGRLGRLRRPAGRTSWVTALLVVTAAMIACEQRVTRTTWVPAYGGPTEIERGHHRPVTTPMGATPPPTVREDDDALKQMGDFLFGWTEPDEADDADHPAVVDHPNARLAPVSGDSSGTD
jgi:hypothetical protein